MLAAATTSFVQQQPSSQAMQMDKSHSLHSSSHSTDESLQAKKQKFHQKMFALQRFVWERNEHEYYSCVIHLLDHREKLLQIERSASGIDLLNKVFEILNFNDERMFFGLLIEDLTDDFVYHWLDTTKTLRKQFKTTQQSIHLHFQVKFYPLDPTKQLQNELTKYFFILQIKEKIFNGKIHCSKSIAALLASYIVQSDLGDFNPDEHRSGYLNEYRFVPFQNCQFENEVEQFHRNHR